MFVRVQTQEFIPEEMVEVSKKPSRVRKVISISGEGKKPLPETGNTNPLRARCAHLSIISIEIWQNWR